MTCLISGKNRNLIVHSEASEPAFLTVMWFRCSFENRRRHAHSSLADPNWRPEDCHQMNETAGIEKSQRLAHLRMLLARTVTVLTIALTANILKKWSFYDFYKGWGQSCQEPGSGGLDHRAELAGLSGMVLWHLALAFLSVKSCSGPMQQQRQRVLSWMWRKEWPLWYLGDFGILIAALWSTEDNRKFERHIVLRAPMRHPSRACGTLLDLAFERRE